MLEGEGSGLVIGLTLTLLSGCLGAQTPSDPQPPIADRNSSAPLGVYVACSEALMHTELLELTGDSFFHYISTDITPESTTRGTYDMHGDTLVFSYEISAELQSYREFLIQRGRPAEEVDERLLYPGRMILDRHRGQPVLWRVGRTRDRGRSAEPPSPYALLVYDAPTLARAGRHRSCGGIP